MKQIMQNYTPTDQLVWKTLFERQRLNLETKGSKIYLNCLDTMQPVMNANTVPSFDAINEWFKTATEWEIVVVPGLIPVEDFFDLLANKQFCSSTWLRTMEQLDYLEEPDMFHDTFGHIPLLADPTFSEFAHRFGQLGQSFKGDTIVLNQLQRLYWFTIEFGLIQEQGLGKVYGAGIISSFGETNRVAAKNCNILPFDINTVLKKVFQNDVLQEDYFLIQSLNELNEALHQASVKLARKIEY
ncbi:MAG: phenylalanine-4-hydroxylase [Crocinitomix sp.]|jgi:phenylalanine-4-hydroxylase